jgi:phage terminase large subunit-like protein
MPDKTNIWPSRDRQTEEDIFDFMRKRNRKKGEIHEDMTPEEISEVVSEHLMENIRKQFAESKERYLASLENKVK